MGFLEERDLTNVPTIPEFFKGKSIFITGGSGFMGKVLIEKLLYSCTDLDKIYLLLRNKKNKNPQERLQKLFSMPCFDRIRKDRPGVFESKVVAVAGDVGEVGLGLSPEDRELIIKKVNIIFNVAATVRFDNPLGEAIKINLRSTMELLEIAKEMKDLYVFVHVSTAYANTQWDPVEERMYPPYADWKEALNICENIDEKTLTMLTSNYLGEIPNTYILTKQLAEHAVYEQRGKLPIVITRPSMVLSSMEEPMPGWIENFNGPIGIFSGAVSGLIRCLYSRKDISMNYVSVDGCIKHFIAAAWIRGTKKLNLSDDIEIYNCCSKEILLNGKLLEYGKEFCAEIPFEISIWTFNCTITTSKSIYYLNVLTKHILPALLLDMILKICGKKSRFLELHRRIYVNNLVTQKFLTTQWDFIVDNFNILRSSLKKEDVQDFYYDFTNICSKEYIRICGLGIKKYLLKEKDENLTKAKEHLKRLTLADKVMHYATYFVVVWAIINSNFVYNLYKKMF